MTLLTVNSKDRVSGTPGSYRWDFHLAYSGISKIAIKEIVIPNTYYNVSSDYNSFQFDSTTVTITAGYYTSFADIATALETALQVEDATFSVSYSSTTGKFTIARTTNFSIDLDGTTLGDIIGVNDGTYSGTNSYTGNAVAILDPNVEITLHMKNLSVTNTDYSDKRSSFVMSFPVKGTIGDVSVYDYHDNPYVLTLNRPIAMNNVYIEFRDRNDNVLDFNGINNSITFDLY